MIFIAHFLTLSILRLGMSVYEQIASRTRARRQRKDQIEDDDDEDDDEEDDRSSVVLQVSEKKHR